MWWRVFDAEPVFCLTFNTNQSSFVYEYIYWNSMNYSWKHISGHCMAFDCFIWIPWFASHIFFSFHTLAPDHPSTRFVGLLARAFICFYCLSWDIFLYTLCHKNSKQTTNFTSCRTTSAIKTVHSFIQHNKIQEPWQIFWLLAYTFLIIDTKCARTLLS